MSDPARSRILVTGATGYIGGRLVPRLLERGYRVRCLVRDPRKLDSRPWASHPQVELVAGDAGEPERLAGALAGCTAAYYLIHSMLAAGPEYRRRDRELARAFARAAAAAGLERIIYLGGLGETGAGLSEHLSSRREVERELAGGPVPVTVLRAAMIIGSGSASFEILRYLVERLPVMVTPRWVSVECQPIAVRDALFYLIAALEEPRTAGRTLDIGGPDVLTYRELMRVMAERMGLRRRLIVPVPVLTPWLSSLWIHLVTPVSRRIAMPLAEGLRNRVVCRNDEARRLLPHEPLPAAAAIDAALGRLRAHEIETTWLDAGPIPGDPDWAGGALLEDRRATVIAAPQEAVFEVVRHLGGERGWLAGNWLWRLRGALDRLVGGPGLSRGRRDGESLAYGDVLDCWRVAAYDPPRLLRLRAEMRLPGEAELRFELSPAGGGAGSTRLVQSARFRPRGLGGLLYWYAVLPLHHLVFGGMIRAIRRSAERTAG